MFLSSLAIDTNDFGVNIKSGTKKIVCTSNVLVYPIHKQQTCNAVKEDDVC